MYYTRTEMRHCVWTVAESAELGVERPQAIVSAALTNWSAILGTRIPELVLRQFGNNIPYRLLLFLSVVW